MQKKRLHRVVVERYCSYIDDNIIMTKYVGENDDRFICQSPHLCRHKNTDSCPRKKENKEMPL